MSDYFPVYWFWATVCVSPPDDTTVPSPHRVEDTALGRPMYLGTINTGTGTGGKVLPAHP